MKQPILDIDVIPYKGRLRIFTDEAKYIEAVREYDPNVDVERVRWSQGQCTWMDDGNIVIGYFTGGVEALVHELSHACMATFDRIRLPISKENDEAFCYLLEYLTKQSLEALKEAKSTAKRKAPRKRKN